MSAKQSMIAMLHQLLKEMELVYSTGSGYYTCVPFAKRFNKLLGQAGAVLGADNTMLSTFEPLPETDPKDPADKSKVLLEVRVEAGQLIALLESDTREDTP